MPSSRQPLCVEARAMLAEDAMDRIDLARARMQACRICVEHPKGTPLPHEPNPVFVISSKAKILIASQAPGLRAHLSGVPFSDPSGIRLRSWLGLNEQEFYDPDNIAILPMGFCFPGYDAANTDLPPRKECAPVWRQYALDLMPQIQLILLIGGHAQRWHLGKGAASMTATVANWRDILSDGSHLRKLPLPHPSWRNSGWLKRNPWFELELLPVLQREIHGLISCRT